MQRTTIILGAVLAAQLVLAAVLQLGLAGGGTAERATGPLAAFERDAIDAVRITGTDGDALRVERGDNGWRLPAADGFPAGAGRVERLLSDLDGFGDRLAVARSEEARERFSVGSGNFERRVELMSGDETVATVLFGGSAGTGRVYARAAGQDTVYEVAFTLQHASVDPQRWYDNAVAGLDPQSVRQAEMPGFVLRRTEGKLWKLVDGASAPAETNPSKALGLVRRLAQPRIRGVARAEPPDAEPVLAYTLTTKEGEEVRFRYFTGGKDSAPHLYRDDQPWRYIVAPKRLAQVRNSSPEKLLAAQDGGDEASAEAAGGEGGSSS